VRDGWRATSCVTSPAGCLPSSSARPAWRRRRCRRSTTIPSPAINAALEGILDDPDTAAREFDMQAGRYSIEHAIDMFGTGDVLVHTWDLARATGQDETLDPAEVHRMFDGMEAMEDAIRNSGHFGPRVLVPGDADEQTKLIAFTGRTP
jgi:uncharacterized protein (TIGR03086 family)